MAGKEEKIKIEPEPEKFTAVGPGAEEPEDEVVEYQDDGEDDEKRAGAEGKEEDERVAGNRDDDAEGEEGGDRGKIRERRRGERQRRKEKFAREHREMDFLRRRNEQLERRFSETDARLSQAEISQIDQRAGQVDDQIREADEIYAKAVSAGDGETAAEAQRVRENLVEGKRQLNGFKQQKTREAQQAANAPPPVDPEIQRRAQDWVAENSDWYDHGGSDEDSQVAKLVEHNLFRERGPDAARTEEYWKEYNRRLARRLPHIFEKKRMREDDDEDDRERSGRNGNGRAAREEIEEPTERAPVRRRGGPTITTGGRERPLKKGEVYIDADRKEAMMAAGVWDDVETRNRYLKSYAKYDVENRKSGRH